MLDATKSDEQRRLLEIELDAVGIRLNKQKPDVVFKKRTTGGSVYFVKFVFVPLLLTYRLCQNHG
jgi:ribosome-interacting GTPase 1